MTTRGRVGPASARTRALLAAAVDHHRSGRLGEAEGLYRAVLARAPEAADVRTQLGITLRDQGRLREAVAALEDVVMVEPGHVTAFLSLGLAYKADGRPMDAMACFARVIALAPQMAEVYGHLAEVLLQIGRGDEAITAGQRAAALAPGEAWAHVNLGVVLQRQGRLADAIESFRRGLAVAPDSAEATSNLGIALEQVGQLDDAVACHERALALGLDPLSAYTNLGRGLLAQNRVDEAVVALRGARALAPDVAWDVAIGAALPIIPASRQAIATARRTLEATLDAVLAGPGRVGAPDERRVGPNAYLAYHGLNDREVQRKMAAVCRHLNPALAWTAPHCLHPGPADRDRLRVGFVSRFLHDHSIGFLMRGIVAELSRERTEVVVLHAGRSVDHVSTAIDASADRAVRLPEDLDAARRRIAAEALDVLVYPEIGMDTYTYLLAHARLAPVQCVSWGHPVTTGIPAVDYFLSSDDLEPEGAEAHYTERLYRLSRLPACYRRPVPPARTPSRLSLGLDAAATLYVCPQSVFKLHPDFDPILAAILGNDPKAHLVFIEGASRSWSEDWRKRFTATAGGMSDRVRFVPRLAPGDFVGLLQTADVLLDPRPFGGGTTTYNALGLGCPIVTWPGPFMRGRVTYACYRQLGVLDCVADSAERYVELALRLANDRGWRADVGARIQSAHAELFDDVAVVREIEDFFARARAEAAV